MSSSFVHAEWEDVCCRLRGCAEYFGSRVPERANSFQQQAEDFCRNDAPSYYQDLLDLVRSAAELANRWRQDCEPEEDDSIAENSPETASDDPGDAMEFVDEVLDESFPASDPPAWSTAAI